MDNELAWFIEGVKDVDVIIEFVDGIDGESVVVNDFDVEGIVLLDTSLWVKEVSFVSVALVSATDDCVVVDCVSIELMLDDCLVGTIIWLEWEVTSSKPIETEEEGVDINGVYISDDPFMGTFVVANGGVSDVPVMLQTEKNNNN